MTTTDDALTIALEISDMILRSNSIPEREDDTNGDMIFDDQRDAYGALRALISPRLEALDPAARETKLINNMIDIADDHFDF